VNLNEVVTCVADLFGYDARLSGISLVPDLDGALPSVEADRGALQQVLVNLVQNAIQALRGRGRGGRIDVVTSMAEGAVRLVVRDDGLGVPEPIRLRLFEPFVTTKGEEGTGLGLAISRGIAREHGGDLVLEGRDDGGSGAQFTLRLPLRAGRAKEAEPSPVELPEGVSGRVLVVDDEHAVRDVVAATLRRLGAEVEAVATAEEALRRCEAGQAYDAVLVDLRLQGASGLDVHRRLRARQPLLARRLVFMTGDLVNDELIAEVRATGRPILEKPFTGEELRRALALGVTA
jgi:two-component system NtrC family sensor kinase